MNSVLRYEPTLYEPTDVDRFPSLDRSDSLPSSSSDGKRSSTRLQDHNHSSETIFALPSTQIHLNTKHLQTATTPDFMGEHTHHTPIIHPTTCIIIVFGDEENWDELEALYFSNVLINCLLQRESHNIT